MDTWMVVLKAAGLIAGIVVVIVLWRRIAAWCLMSEFKREVKKVIRECQEHKEKEKIEGE